ncbi:hypothetical protein [Adhaeribacter terreus]|uniref:STAS domain-containing protein n=1 Tax=Adhaeribacter terreus TaxID=529703 RepID=A0ABW0E896_9BACT
MKEENLIDKLNGLNFSLEETGDITILNFGKDYEIQEYGFIWDIIHESKKHPSEVDFLFKSDQLILDFSNLNYIDQTGGEFTVLNETYKVLKGKEILFCGINENIEFIFKMISEEEYSKLLKFETREKAIEYYRAQKNK